MWQTIKGIIFKPGFLLVVFGVSAILISVQVVMLGTHPFKILDGPVKDDIMNKPENFSLFIGQTLTEYNNYLIFKSSWFHLLDGTNLYGLYPSQHWDFYKYSPTFAFFMAPLAYLSDMVGLSIWNLMNGLAVFFAICMLPFGKKVHCIMLWFVFNDMMTCYSNTQSNGLMCGLMIAGFACMERGKPMWATLWLVLSAFIKVYGAIGFCLVLFYPDKMKFILCAALWTIVLAALPLAITPFNTLIWQYQNWIALMRADASKSVGLSVAGWLQTWFNIRNVKGYVTVAGVLLFLVTLTRFRLYSDKIYRLLMLACMLIWVIIFNHKAESSTFIIGVSGVAVWYFATPRAAWRTALMWFVLLFTCMSTTDIFPPVVKDLLIYPYNIKVFPCIVVWCVVFAELMTLRPAGRGPAAEIVL